MNPLKLEVFLPRAVGNTLVWNMVTFIIQCAQMNMCLTISIFFIFFGLDSMIFLQISNDKIFLYYVYLKKRKMAQILEEFQSGCSG